MHAYVSIVVRELRECFRPPFLDLDIGHKLFVKVACTDSGVPSTLIKSYGRSVDILASAYDTIAQRSGVLGMS